MNASPYMTRQQAADWLSCSVDTIDRMSCAKKLRAVVVTINKKRSIRIVRADVLAILPEVVA